MKRVYLAVMLLGLFAMGALAQAPARTSDDGPVWRIAYYDVKPGKNTEYIKFLREHSKPILDEQKKQGLFLDYKFFTQPTTNGVADWDVAIAVSFKTYAEALDYDEMRAKKNNELTIKHYGSEAARTKANEYRDSLRDMVAVRYIREQILLPLN